MASYDGFAADYGWLLTDEDLGGDRFLAPYEHVLDQLAEGARVLDASCGVGVEAVALARRGFEVVATDASAAMVAQATAWARACGVDVRTETATWEALAGVVDGPFALVLCTGNSLVHADGPAGRRRALAAFRSLLADQGRLVIGTRDFEVLRAERPTVEVAPVAVRRHGTTGVVAYVWSLPEAWGATHVASVHLALVTGDRVEHRHHDVAFTPYRNDELLADLAAAGLVVVDGGPTGERRYALVARAVPVP